MMVYGYFLSSHLWCEFGHESQRVTGRGLVFGDAPCRCRNENPSRKCCFLDGETLWNDPPFCMGKLTISTGPFSIAMYSYVKLPEGSTFLSNLIDYCSLLGN